MNIGSCPYDNCDGELFEPLPDKVPAFSFFNCEKCNGKIWYRHSRIDSVAFTEKYFLEIYNVNHETMKITSKEGITG